MGKSFAEWLTSLKKYKFFVIVDHDYLMDNFNYFGLKKYFDRFPEAQVVIRGSYKPRIEEDPDLLKQAIHLYGLIHARYLVTLDGIGDMKEKFSDGEFPKCPRYLCNGHSCLPYGTSEIYGENTLKLFCPSCCDVYDMYIPLYQNIDGAFFGPNYVHILKQRYRTVTPSKPLKELVPRVFGFKMSRQKPKKIKSKQNKPKPIKIKN